jgi:hypothetical protein
MLTAILVLVATAPPRFTCPTGEGAAKSPDGRWRLTCVEKPVAEEDHRIYIQRVGASSRVLLRAVPRWADFFWSPSGAKLAVVDGQGSDTTETYLYDPYNPNRAPAKVMDLLEAQVRPSDLEPFREFDHLYLTVTAWVSETRLGVRLYGHGDRRSASRDFVVRLP